MASSKSRDDLPFMEKYAIPRIVSKKQQFVDELLLQIRQKVGHCFVNDFFSYNIEYNPSGVIDKTHAIYIHLYE